MHHLTDNTFDPQLVLQNVIHRPLRWIVPAAVIAAAAFGYAVVRSPKWEASQSLVVRDEAVGRTYSAQGKFASVDDMQTAQETVLEIAKSRSVVKEALEQVGANASPLAVEKLRGRINVKAPNGAEFGRTEVFHLVVSDSDRQRSLELTAAICDALEQRLGQLRNEKAASLINELEETVDLTRNSLNNATNRLAKLEAEVGGDLAELRILNEQASGQSPLRQSVTNIRDELRAEKQAQLANQQLLELLVQSQDNPESILAMPSQLLQSQPALQRLKDGLVDAQLRTSQFLGLMSLAHPQVQAAMEEEENVRRRLHGELPVAIRGLKMELSMNDRRIVSLSNQLSEVQQRMTNIAGVRAEYSNLAADVQQNTEAWNKAQRDLADARASQAAADSASLITRLDGPQAGAYPAGPSRSMICLAGLAGGLCFGLGVVVLTASPIANGASVATDAAAVAPATTRRERRGFAPVGNLSLKDALLRVAFGGPANS
jgi:uncharacterized protein involved in exopolysaccharide biosynthesis